MAATGLPAALGRAPMKTVTSEIAREVYAHPRQQLFRLERAGLLHRVADGFYVLVPQERVGTSIWKPELEPTAAGIGTAAFGSGSVALMGLSAARLHGVIPRALAFAVVAVPRRRAEIALSDRVARIQFLPRNLDVLDLEMVQTELGPTLVTSREQTALDLAHRPQLGHAADEAVKAIRLLMRDADPKLLERIAAASRMKSALRRAREIADG